VALFSRRDRIAIAVIAVLILAGWGARLLVRPNAADDVRVIRGAVTVPASPSLMDTIAAAPAAKQAGLRIDINRAGTAEFERLPAIGPVKAAAIVRYREKHGPFSKPADLMKVEGIGPKTYGLIDSLITVGGVADVK